MGRTASTGPPSLYKGALYLYLAVTYTFTLHVQTLMTSSECLEETNMNHKTALSQPEAAI
jgi:hypothetical protein